MSSWHRGWQCADEIVRGRQLFASDEMTDISRKTLCKGNGIARTCRHGDAKATEEIETSADVGIFFGRASGCCDAYRVMDA